MESSQPNNSPSNFLLPTLKQSHAVPPGTPGQWKIYEKKVFEQIAKSLDFKEPGEDIGSVSALPNMWARALSLEMSLHDKENKLRQAILPQWEGMLAAIALAEVRGFKLTAELVELTAVKTSGDYGGGAKRFANSLEQLAPDISSNILYKLSDLDKPWYDIYIFYWNDNPVGATSPSTLIWPAEDGDWTGLPWWSKAEKRLRSPRGSRYITRPEERAQLWLWLDKLLKELDRHKGLESAIARVVELVRDFRDSFGTQPVQQELLPSRKSYFGETANNRGSLIALNRPIAAQSRRSNVELVSSAGKQPTAKAILVDPDQPRQWNDADSLPKQWNEKPENIWIHDTITYSQLGTENIEELKKRWKNQVTVLQPDDLLLEKFAYIEQEEALPGALLPAGGESLQNAEGDLITPLLPLKPILLDYFSTDDLLRMLQLERSSKGVRVTLEIPLSGTGDSPRTYRLVRDYALEEKNCKPQVPVLEIWPNLAAAGWQEYYVFYSDGQAGNETFQVNLTSLAGEPKNSHQFDDNLGAHQIVRLPKFPTYISCQDSAKGNQPMGLILLPPAQATPKTNPTEWTVGVDFGTSFTTVSFNQGGQPQMLELNSDSLSLRVTASKTATRNTVLGELFLREEIMGLPLSSVLTTRGWTAEQAEIRTVLDGRIYVPTSPREFQPEIKWICTGLKWSQDNKRDAFLSHLALEIVARAARDNAQKIQWAISYPSAYSQETIKNTYNRTWRKLTEELGKATGIAQDCPLPDNPSFYRTESLALAQYFADVEKPGKDFKRATCIDLGGGTSDISIWQENTLVHQCSVKFAGRNLFSRIVELYPNLLQYFGLSEDLLGELREEKLDAKLDILLRENSAAWLKNKPDEEPCVQEFLQIMAVGLGGLYYYIGLLLKVLHGEKPEGKEEGKYSKPEITRVYLGGNGSRFLHWLAEGGEFDEFSLLNRLFSRMLAEGSEFEDIGVKTTLSKEPKTEVALGLVADKKTSKLNGLESTTEEDPLIAGEAYKLAGEKCSPLTRLQLVGEEKIKQLQVVDEQELEVLPQFLYQFYLALQELKLVKVVKPLDREVYQPSPKVEDNLSLWRDVSQRMFAYHSQVDGKTSEAELEPPYILALKSLVDVLAQRWASKWKRLNS